MNFIKHIRVNDKIKTKEVMVIADDGSSMGVMNVAQARDMAKEQNMDLVEVSPNANPPVCKILDYGKYKYKLSKKAQEAKKKQKIIHVKEIKMKPNIDEHDYQFKTKHIRRFIEDGNKVKITILFRGRELLHTHIGKEMLEKIAEDMEEIAIVESAPSKQDRTLIMILSPRSKK